MYIFKGSWNVQPVRKQDFSFYASQSEEVMFSFRRVSLDYKEIIAIPWFQYSLKYFALS